MGWDQGGDQFPTCHGFPRHTTGSPNQKFAYFVLYLKTILKILYASNSKLSKELKNGIKIQVSQAVFELLIKTLFWLFWSITYKTAWPIRISMPFLNSLDNLL